MKDALKLDIYFIHCFTQLSHPYYGSFMDIFHKCLIVNLSCKYAFKDGIFDNLKSSKSGTFCRFISKG